MTGRVLRVQTAWVSRTLRWALALVGVVSMGLSAALELSHPPPRDMSLLALTATTGAVLVSAVLGVRVVQHYPRTGSAGSSS